MSALWETSCKSFLKIILNIIKRSFIFEFALLRRRISPAFHVSEEIQL